MRDTVTLVYVEGGFGGSVTGGEVVSGVAIDVGGVVDAVGEEVGDDAVVVGVLVAVLRLVVDVVCRDPLEPPELSDPSPPQPGTTVYSCACSGSDCATTS